MSPEPENSPTDDASSGDVEGEARSLPVFGGSGVMPGIDLSNSAGVRDAMDDDEVESLR